MPTPRPTRRRGAAPAAPLLGPAVRARPPRQRLNEFREDLPVWDYSDADARAAFIFLMLGVLISPLALSPLALLVQSPNKRAWLYSVKGLLLGLLTLVLVVVCLVQTLSVPAAGTPGGGR